MIRQAQQKHARAILSVEQKTSDGSAQVRVIFAKGWLIGVVKLSSLALLTDYYRNLTEGEAMTIKRFFGISFGELKSVFKI